MSRKLRKYTTENISKKIKLKSIISAFFRIIIYIIIFLLTIYLFIILLGNFSKENTKFQINSFVVMSGSMEPTLKINDLIFNQKVEQSELNEGDIISFYIDEKIVTHRINKIIEEDGKILYQTKGDNNNSTDETLVKYNQIIGKYILKIPKIGYLIKNLQTQFGIIIIIVILVLREFYIRNKSNKEDIRHQKRLEKEAKEESEKQ